MLPALLTRTDVVLELRDARLPLTSVNRNFEGKWLRHEVVEKNLPPHTTHLHDADDNGVFCDPERLARVVRFLHNTRKRNPQMTKVAYVHHAV
jgi:hypothetical protein